MTPDAVLPHNTKAAATWNSGGQHYDRISHSIADSIEHCVHRLAPRRGERVLDVATGTGWTARRVATRGATVIAYHAGFKSDLGVAMPRDYLVTIGVGK